MYICFYRDVTKEKPNPAVQTVPSPKKYVPLFGKLEAKKRLMAFSGKTSFALNKVRSVKKNALVDADDETKSDALSTDKKNPLGKKKKKEEKMSVIEQIRNDESRIRQALGVNCGSFNPYSPQFATFLDNPESLKRLEEKGKQYVTMLEKRRQDELKKENHRKERKAREIKERELDQKRKQEREKERLKQREEREKKYREEKKKKEEKEIAKQKEEKEKMKLREELVKSKNKEMLAGAQGELNSSRGYIKELTGSVETDERKESSARRRSKDVRYETTLELPKSWKEFKEGKYTIQTIKSIIKKQKYNSYISSRLMEDLVASGIDESSTRMYPARLLQYTKSQPSVSFAPNPQKVDAYFQTRQDLLDSIEPDIIDIIEEIWNSKVLQCPGLDDEERSFNIHQWYNESRFNVDSPSHIDACSKWDNFDVACEISNNIEQSSIVSSSDRNSSAMSDYIESQSLSQEIGSTEGLSEEYEAFLQMVTGPEQEEQHSVDGGDHDQQLPSEERDTNDKDLKKIAKRESKRMKKQAKKEKKKAKKAAKRLKREQDKMEEKIISEANVDKIIEATSAKADVTKVLDPLRQIHLPAVVDTTSTAPTNSVDTTDTVPVNTVHSMDRQMDSNYGSYHSSETDVPFLESISDEEQSPGAYGLGINSFEAEEQLCDEAAEPTKDSCYSPSSAYSPVSSDSPYSPSGSPPTTPPLTPPPKPPMTPPSNIRYTPPLPVAPPKPVPSPSKTSQASTNSPRHRHTSLSYLQSVPPPPPSLLTPSTTLATQDTDTSARAHSLSSPLLSDASKPSRPRKTRFSAPLSLFADIPLPRSDSPSTSSDSTPQTSSPAVVFEVDDSRSSSQVGNFSPMSIESSSISPDLLLHDNNYEASTVKSPAKKELKAITFKLGNKKPAVKLLKKTPLTDISLDPADIRAIRARRFAALQAKERKMNKSTKIISLADDAALGDASPQNNHPIEQISSDKTTDFNEENNTLQLDSEKKEHPVSEQFTLNLCKKRELNTTESENGVQASNDALNESKRSKSSETDNRVDTEAINIKLAGESEESEHEKKNMNVTNESIIQEAKHKESVEESNTLPETAVHAQDNIKETSKEISPRPSDHSSEKEQSPDVKRENKNDKTTETSRDKSSERIKKSPDDPLDKNEERKRDDSDRNRERNREESSVRTREKKREGSSDKIRERKCDNSTSRNRERKREDSADKSRERKHEDSSDKSGEKKREESSDKIKEKKTEYSTDKSREKKRGDSTDKSRERKREDSSDRSREKTDEKKPTSPERRDKTASRKRGRSPDRRRDSSPSTKKDKSERSPERRRVRSPNRRRERSADRRRDRSPERRRGDRSPDRRRNRSPDRRSERSPERRRERSSPYRRERSGRDRSPDRRRDRSQEHRSERSPERRDKSYSRDRDHSTDGPCRDSQEYLQNYARNGSNYKDKAAEHRYEETNRTDTNIEQFSSPKKIPSIVQLQYTNKHTNYMEEEHHPEWKYDSAELDGEYMENWHEHQMKTGVQNSNNVVIDTSQCLPATAPSLPEYPVKIAADSTISDSELSCEAGTVSAAASSQSPVVEEHFPATTSQIPMLSTPTSSQQENTPSTSPTGSPSPPVSPARLSLDDRLAREHGLVLHEEPEPPPVPIPVPRPNWNIPSFNVAVSFKTHLSK